MISVQDLPSIALSQVEFHVEDLDVERATRAYEEIGFIVVRGLLRSLMPKMLEEIEASVALAHAELPEATHARYGWLTKSGGVFTERSVELESEPARRQLIVAPLDQRSSPTMAACARHPTLMALARRMLSDEVNPIGTGQCMYKEARGTAMSLHQDGVYTKVEGYRDVVTTYAYVVPTPLERGCIWLVPYSHRLDLLPHDETGPNTGAIRKDVCDWHNAVPLPGEPGDTFFWQWKTIHGSRPNFTDTPRPTLVARYGREREARLMIEKGLGQW